MFFKRKMTGLTVGVIFFSLFLSACQEEKKEQAENMDATLQIWWNQGYYPEENEAIESLVRQWEKETGHKVKLSIQSNNDMLKQIQVRLKGGKMPDIVFAHPLEISLAPRLAHDGKLEDLTEVVETVKDRLEPVALQSVFMYNSVEKKRAYYAVPLLKMVLHLHYWKDMLTEAGLKESDIPQDWDGFWKFWGEAQKRLAKKNKGLYGLGLPMSSESSDTYSMFEQFLEAHHVEIIDDEGNLRVDEPGVKEGLAKALADYSKHYAAGLVPKEAVDWNDADNNRQFLNRAIIMTGNNTLSIPGARWEDRDIYENKMRTIGFPNGPDGKRVRPAVSVKQVVVFKDSANKKLAKKFLKFLIQPENIVKFIKGTHSRFFPVMPELFEDPYWKETKDPHISGGTKQLMSGPTRVHLQVANPAYSGIQKDKTWGRALERIVIDKISPEQAAKEAIVSIRKVFAEWK